MQAQLTPEMIQELNQMMLTPLQALVDMPHVVKMTLAITISGNDLGITIERYDDPRRFYWDAEPRGDDDYWMPDGFDPPMVAYATPELAFEDAVEHLYVFFQRHRGTE